MLAGTVGNHSSDEVAGSGGVARLTSMAGVAGLACIAGVAGLACMVGPTGLATAGVARVLGHAEAH